MYYFSYGSNMSTRRLEQRLGSVHTVGVATLNGYSLAWHKRGRDGSAKCDADHSGAGEDCIVGVVFDIPRAEKPVLDRYEGLGNGYREKRVAVTLAAGERLDVFTYTATDIDPGLNPYEWYKQHVLTGAREHRLPADYVNEIQRVVSISDPQKDRHMLELAIYG